MNFRAKNKLFYFWRENSNETFLEIFNHCGVEMTPEITIDIEAEEETDFFPEIPEDEELEIELPEFFDNNKLSVESTHKRDRTISESVKMKSIPKSPSRSELMMKRNKSTPGLGRLARLDSINEDQREVMKVLDSYNNRRNSSYLVYEVQVKNIVKLQRQLRFDEKNYKNLGNIWLKNFVKTKRFCIVLTVDNFNFT